MPSMRTAVVSDLHLGGLVGADVARDGEEREALVEAVSGADRVVLLGDVVELRERPLADSLEVARPVFEQLGRALAGRPVVLVPGNHDHALAEPWLARLRLDARGLPTETEWPVQPEEGAAGRIAAWMPDVELTLAYPGLHLRDDVYATHGHYLDLHLTIPRLESIAASAMARLTGGGKPQRPPAAGRLGGTRRPGARIALPARPGHDPGSGGRAERPRARPVPGHTHGRGAAPGRTARNDARGRGLGAGGRPRDLRPHPPSRPAARRRARRVDHALRQPALEQRQLALRGRLHHDRSREPLLAGDGSDPRGVRAAPTRERAGQGQATELRAAPAKLNTLATYV